MKILSRILSPKMRQQKTNADSTVHRRVEVTVDREMVSILVPAHPQRAPNEEKHGDGPVEQISEELPAKKLTRPARE